MFEKILVPLDGSPLAETALGSALTLAQWSDSRVYVLRVPTYRQVIIPDATGEAVLWEDNSEESARSEAEEYLRKVQQRYLEHKICTRVVDGDEAGTIVDVARGEKVGLVVISTHGYSGLTRWVLGSVTEKVLRAAPCPVMVVRNEEPIRNVLLTLDGSELSHSALAPGLEAARRLGAEVTLFRAYQRGERSGDEGVRLDWTEDAAERHLHEGARQSVLHYLESIARQQELPGQSIKVVAMEGPPAHTILDFAGAQGYELIVMATHGRSGLRRWVYGSITEKVLRNADCNLLIVRPAPEALK